MIQGGYALSDSSSVQFMPSTSVDSSSVELSSKQLECDGIPYAYIYTLSDPRSGEVRYVGKSFDVRQRYRGHLSCAEKNHRGYWLRQLKAAGLAPIITVVQTIYDTSDQSWEIAERFWIAILRGCGCRLVNSDSGGLTGRRLSVEHRQKIAKAHSTPEALAQLRKVHCGRRKSEASKAKASKALIGHSVNAETRRKISVTSKGRYPTAETRAKMSASQIGRRWSDSMRRKMANVWRGRKHTPASRLRMSEAAKKRSQKQRNKKGQYVTQ